MNAKIENYAADYAYHYEIPVEHVRATLDGPDDSGRYLLRLDSYEHPGCEDERLVLDADGEVIDGVEYDG